MHFIASKEGEKRPLAKVAALVLVAVLIAWAPVAAQTAPLSIDSASLRLWPEYDDPGLLVIVSGSFNSAATFPQQVAFPLPAGARGIQATMSDSTGALLSQPWERKDDQMVYTLPQRGFQVEYYLDRSSTSSQREIQYTFKAPYAIQSLEIEVQQPARSTDFSMTPAAASSAQASDGLTYYRYTKTNVSAGDTIPITLRYAKTDDRTSVTPSSNQQNAASNQASKPQLSAPAALETYLPWVLIGIGVLALTGAGVYWYTSRMRSELRLEAPRTPVVRSSSGAGGRAGAKSAGGGEAAFCRKCGNRLRPSDRFCGKCGAAVR